MSEQVEQSRLKYCKDVIKDKNFKLMKWKLNDKNWTHDHCDFCGKHISDKNESKNEAYINKNEDWFCKECFNKYKRELNLIEIR